MANTCCKERPLSNLISAVPLNNDRFHVGHAHTHAQDSCSRRYPISRGVSFPFAKRSPRAMFPQAHRARARPAS